LVLLVIQSTTNTIYIYFIFLNFAPEIIFLSGAIFHRLEIFGTRFVPCDFAYAILEIVRFFAVFVGFASVCVLEAGIG